MQLNMDCVRSILFCIEANTGLRKSCFFIDTGLSDAMEFLGDTVDLPAYQTELLNDFNNDELIYHVHYCIDAELVVAADSSTQYQTIIADLTPKGHEFLSNSRNNENWQKAKDIGGKVGAFGLNMASKIAEGVVTALVNQQLKLL